MSFGLRHYKSLTKKQNELMNIAKGGLKRINILHGSVRSGKTWISLILWCIWIQNMPKDKTYIMTAKTLGTLKRNCLDLLEILAGRKNFKYSISKKEGVLYGRKIYFEGVSDSEAESKIRGMTLQGAYCDELTLFTEDFFNMLLSRLSETNAKLFGTTNPDNPNHWFKVNYIDRKDELDFFMMEFLIDDNTFLDKRYVEELKKEYTGVFYRRFILGEWCSAEGLVYPMFDKSKNVVRDIPNETDETEYYISIDYGTLNPCSMGLWQVNKEEAVRIKECYYSGKKSRKLLTDEEYYDLLEKLSCGYPIKCVVIDPSAASFITTIRRRGKFTVRKANNNVLDGIRITGTLLQNGKLKIHESCTDSIREFETYSWDEKSPEDKVIKEFDHAMDDIRYFCATILGKILL